jgi:hypothetical protein
MKLEKVIEVLANHQMWRMGDDDVEPTEPKELTEALNKAIYILYITLQKK